MTNRTDPTRMPGYRGSLPTREDRLARPWIFTVLGIFALVVLLSVAGVPSRFIPDPTPLPTPLLTPLPSASESAEASPDESASESAEASADASADASPDGTGSAEPTASE